MNNGIQEGPSIMPADPEHHRQLDAALRQAFDPEEQARPVTPDDVLAWIDADIDGVEDTDDNADVGAPLPMWRRPVFRAGLALAAALVVGITTFQWLLPTIVGGTHQQIAQLPPRLPVYASAGETYAAAAEGDFEPDWTCAPEDLNDNLAYALDGHALAVAKLPASVQLLGWSYPEGLAGPLMDPGEIVLLANSPTGPRLLVIALERDAREPDVDVSEGLFVHEAKAGPLKLIEIAADDTSLMAAALGD